RRIMPPLRQLFMALTKWCGMVVRSTCLLEWLEARTLFSFGQVDTNWGTNGRVLKDVGVFEAEIGDVVVSQGKIWAAGDDAIIKYNPDGTVDPSFGINGIVKLSGRTVYQLLLTDAG